MSTSPQRELCLGSKFEVELFTNSSKTEQQRCLEESDGNLNKSQYVTNLVWTYPRCALSENGITTSHVEVESNSDKLTPSMALPNSLKVTKNSLNFSVAHLGSFSGRNSRHFSTIIYKIVNQNDLSDFAYAMLMEAHEMLRERKRLWMLYLAGKSIYVEGLIGAGKSTLCRILERVFELAEMSAQVHLEHKNESYLKLFKDNQKEHALGFQMYMLTQRMLTAALAVSNCKSAPETVLIFDRSLFGDRSFEEMHVNNGNICGDGDKAYLATIQQASKIIPPPDYMIHLDVDPCISNKRTARRDDVDANAYDENYHTKLKGSYTKCFKRAKEANVGIVCHTVKHDENLEHFYKFDGSWDDVNTYLCIKDAMRILDELVNTKTNWINKCLSGHSSS